MTKLARFIRKRPTLIWYTKNYDGLNAEAIVEATLNYGDWDDVQELIKILGINRMARIFKKATHRKRVNYHPSTAHYFHLYFLRHASSAYPPGDHYIHDRFCSERCDRGKWLVKK